MPLCTIMPGTFNIEAKYEISKQERKRGDRVHDESGVKLREESLWKTII